MNDKNAVVTCPSGTMDQHILSIPSPNSTRQTENLIELLKRDGRANVTCTPARDLDLSVGTVRARMKRLLDAQIITINGWVDPTALNSGVFVLVSSTCAEMHSRLLSASHRSLRHRSWWRPREATICWSRFGVATTSTSCACSISSDRSTVLHEPRSTSHSST